MNNSALNLFAFLIAYFMVARTLKDKHSYSAFLILWIPIVRSSVLSEQMLRPYQALETFGVLNEQEGFDFFTM
jgi:hypothetical protein